MEESKGIVELMQRFGDAVRRGDADALVDVIADDDEIVFIGTDPAEWWSGHDAVIDVYRQQLEAVGPGGLSLADLDVSAYEDGDLGWFAGRSAFVVPDGEVPVRMSGTARRAGGDWRLVQFHVSIGVPNEEAVGQELPTSPG